MGRSNYKCCICGHQVGYWKHPIDGKMGYVCQRHYDEAVKEMKGWEQKRNRNIEHPKDKYYREMSLPDDMKFIEEVIYSRDYFPSFTAKLEEVDNYLRYTTGKGLNF